MQTAAKLIERDTLRISINALADYMVAGPSGRRCILKTQKRPKPFVTSTYTRAEDAIVRYLAKRGEDKEILLSAAHDFLRRPARSSGEKQKLRLCSQAVSAFLQHDILAELDLESLDVVRAPRSQPKLIIAGVRVSVRPELNLSWTDRRGQPTVGAIKLRFPKTNLLSAQAGAFAATAINEHLVARTDLAERVPRRPPTP